VLALFWACLFSTSVSAQDNSPERAVPTDWTFGGHTKYHYIHTRIPDDSVLYGINGDYLQDHNLEVRLKTSARRDRWDFDMHAQLIGVHSDTLSGLRGFPGLLIPGSNLINDDRRWFNLTHEVRNQGKNASVVRLDRVNIGYTGDRTVIRFGRQAISWGNGLLFTPMDILNPFDPATVDKEYKSGDDMLYGQYLLANGNDIQAVAVVRRNPLNGEVEQDSSSTALKYHGFLESNEYDLLLTEHYGETLIGLGVSTDFGGAIWRGDLVWNDTDTGSVISAVVGTSYSWVLREHNWTGFLEYFYNGFGQSDGDYSTSGLASNPDLLKRLTRGELYNLGRHYLGASVTVEVTPLFNFTPNIFVNLTDPSALAQLVFSYDWKQDVLILGAVNFPIGPNGSEYGGIDSEQDGLYISTGPSLFAQLAWYF
ncbi:MAG: hypothetical protein GY732_18730, partial [Gammaproteobacteria bacterium]|nr:hypothetical protein [Gammaproteobacteria bacterium]